MSKKKILYLNLSTNEKDISLGFSNSWLSKFADKFESVDLISLNISSNNQTEFKNVNIFGISESEKLSRIDKYLKLKNLVKDLTQKNDYSICFSHMSPLLSIIANWYNKNKKTVSILWYTHPMPKELIKKIVLYISLFFNNQIVTASKSSFPYFSKKVNVIGHAIDYEAFLNKKTNISNNNFVILSRISKSKNLELSIDCFLKSKFNQDSITVIGDAVTHADMEYKAFLAEKYRTKNNVIFKGMIPHKELPDVLRSYSYHINSTPPGFYDKSVLETLAAGIYNFYLNGDYDKHFDPKTLKYTKFSSKENSLTDLLNSVYELNNNKILEIVSFAQYSVSKESVETISDRVLSTVEN